MPSSLSRLQQWFEAHPRLRVARFSLIVPLSAGVMEGICPSLGTKVQPEFYAVAAQVIPVLLLAFFVEERGHMTMATQILERWRTVLLEVRGDYSKEKRLLLEGGIEGMQADINKLAELRWVLVAMMGAAAAWGETFSLYALASNKTSTFLLVATSVSILMIFRKAATSVLRHFRLSV